MLYHIEFRALIFSASAFMLAGPAVADHAPGTGDAEADKIEEIIVSGQRSNAEFTSIIAERESAVDAAAVLKRLPGADANRNGALTGIAQYRGMYGDRVSVAIDGIGLIGGGPNAMDSPLSYVSPMITESLTVERGIASVSKAPETIGGHVEATLNRGHFMEPGDSGYAGMAGARYSDNANATSTAARLTAASDRHRLTLLGQFDRADDLDTPEGRIIPSELTRDRYDLSYGFRGDTGDLLVYAGGVDTRDTGTPALAMDINYIDTRLYGLKWRQVLTNGVTLTTNVGYNDVDHLMDNFSLRPNPASPMMFRQNRAQGDGTVFALSASFERDGYTVTTGIDGRTASHDSVITNPNSSMFSIHNFNDVSRDVLGGFASVELNGVASLWELGIRYTDVQTDAGEVAVSGMMGMMATATGGLADAFNAADRDLSFGNVEAVFKYTYQFSDDLSVRLDLGSKARAPSYQELYLWLPLQATGGLADGRNYIGNLDLDAERSNELVVGFDWSSDRFGVSPQAYFRDVADYIQGVPATAMPANMVASMMSGNPALQFDNVDAEIYGVDVGWHYVIGDRLRLEGTASYSRGRRTDLEDNLYRLPPLNASIALNYVSSAWSLRSEVIAYDSQDDVSAYNGEQPTAGYAVVNGLLSWDVGQALRIDVQALNLFDESYQDHLAGVNRVMNADLPVGARLFGAGRTVTLGAVLTF
jgi:iron complex outermembrane receptor protein